MEHAEAVATAEGMPEDGAVDVVVEPAPVDPTAEWPTILLEDGGRAKVHPRNFQQNGFRIGAADGRAYDHCSDAPDGEWVYRHKP